MGKGVPPTSLSPRGTTDERSSPRPRGEVSRHVTEGAGTVSRLLRFGGSRAAPSVRLRRPPLPEDGGGSSEWNETDLPRSTRGKSPAERGMGAAATDPRRHPRSERFRGHPHPRSGTSPSSRGGRAKSPFPLPRSGRGKGLGKGMPPQAIRPDQDDGRNLSPFTGRGVSKSRMDAGVPMGSEDHTFRSSPEVWGGFRRGEDLTRWSF